MATSERKFYKTVIQITILSETPYHGNSLSQIDSDITEGDCSGAIVDIKRNADIDAETIVKLLKEQGSSPEFFQLNDKAEDLDENL